MESDCLPHKQTEPMPPAQEPWRGIVMWISGCMHARVVCAQGANTLGAVWCGAVRIPPGGVAVARMAGHESAAQAAGGLGSDPPETAAATAPHGPALRSHPPVQPPRSVPKWAIIR